MLQSVRVERGLAVHTTVCRLDKRALGTSKCVLKPTNTAVNFLIYGTSIIIVLRYVEITVSCLQHGCKNYNILNQVF